jgi:hypothetical protein
MTNALEQAIEAEHKLPPQNQCQTCTTIRALTPAEEETFNAALKNGVAKAVLARALKQLGHTISADSIALHLKRGHSV